MLPTSKRAIIPTSSVMSPVYHTMLSTGQQTSTPTTQHTFQAQQQQLQQQHHHHSSIVKVEQHHQLLNLTSGSGSNEWVIARCQCRHRCVCSDHHHQHRSSSVESRTSSDNGAHGGKCGNNGRPNRDPLSHRIIEKRRRDRMNNCLTNLSKMIPNGYLKKGRGRIEKTEIIEMAIRYMEQLKAATPLTCVSPVKQEQEEKGVSTELSGVEVDEMTAIVRKGHLTPTLTRLAQEHHRRGYDECIAEVYRVLGSVRMDDTAKHSIVAHLRGIYHNNSQQQQHQQQQQQQQQHQQQQQQPIVVVTQPPRIVLPATIPSTNHKQQPMPTTRPSATVSGEQPLNMSLKRAKSSGVVDDASIHSNSATSGGDSVASSSSVYPSSPSSERTCASTSTTVDTEESTDIALFALHATNGYYIPCTVKSAALHESTRAALTTGGEHSVQCHPVTIPVHFVATSTSETTTPAATAAHHKKRPPKAHEHTDTGDAWLGVRASMGQRTHA